MLTYSFFTIYQFFRKNLSLAQFIPEIYNKITIKILGYYWGVTVKLNKTLQSQILHLGKNKGVEEKEVVVLKEEISKNSTAQSELEQLKRRGRMLNSGTASLDHILGVRKSSKGLDGLGDRKGSFGTKVIVRIGA